MKGLEPLTTNSQFVFFQLNYIFQITIKVRNTATFVGKVGVEPTQLPWHGSVLPLNYLPFSKQNVK
jgi:hypothetical protein